MQKNCKACRVELPKHTHVEVRWGLSTIEGKSLLAQWFYCVQCTAKIITILFNDDALTELKKKVSS